MSSVHDGVAPGEPGGDAETLAHAEIAVLSADRQTVANAIGALQVGVGRLSDLLTDGELLLVADTARGARDRNREQQEGIRS